MNWNSRKDQVWEKGKKIRGKDPNRYRMDSYGNEIDYNQYGEDTLKGWEVDHIKPASKGGTNDLDNLQPLQTEANREKGDMPWDAPRGRRRNR